MTHKPTPEGRELVAIHATVGTPHETIAGILGITAKTLRNHYREELDNAMAQANAKVGGALFQKAMGGDTTAMIFWMKTRAGWREQQDLTVKADSEFSGLAIRIVS
jgi:predicted transcriptional regulator